MPYAFQTMILWRIHELWIMKFEDLRVFNEMI